MINPTGQTLDRLSRQLRGRLAMLRSLNDTIVGSDNPAARISRVARFITTRRYAMREVVSAGLTAVAMIVVIWSMTPFAKLNLAGRGAVSDASATIGPSGILERLERNCRANTGPTRSEEGEICASH
jgi:hypothetical protein